MWPRAAYYNLVGRALQIHGTACSNIHANLRTKFHVPSLNLPLVIAFKSHTKEMSAQLRCPCLTLRKNIILIQDAQGSLS